MKRILIALVLCLAGTFAAIGQQVSYTHKAFAPDGCIVNYRVVMQDTTCYIEVNFQADLSKFTESPTMMVRTFTGEVFKLPGEKPSTEVLSEEVYRDGVLKTVTAFSSTVKFQANSSQMETLKNGIAKVRLSTEPYEHEKEFKKDKIGKPLYDLYVKAKNKDADF